MVSTNKFDYKMHALPSVVVFEKYDFTIFWCVCICEAFVGGFISAKFSKNNNNKKKVENFNLYRKFEK